ncbi:MAG: hypothetical protein JXB00_02705 [Bacteroidales bacterium]|nr:hypothetical protein [Bacteroidales bacterium]
MGKLLVSFIYILVLLLIGGLQPSDIRMSMNVPGEVVAGEEFEVTITLSKGDLESFSRFQMEIPAGLTAISNVTANADFTFSDKRVRMIWLRLPESQEFTFSYKIKVDERLKGTFSLDGQFSFISDNERQQASISPQSINILQSPNIDPSLVVDISEFEEKVIQQISPVSEDAANVACIRQKPFLNDQAGEYIVNLLVSKQDRSKFAKIEETIPEGYTAVALETADAIFTVKNQTVKFLWMNLPAQPDFNVGYRLIPKNGIQQAEPRVSGTFSFMAADKTLSVDIAETGQTVQNLSTTEIQNLVAELKSRPVAVSSEQTLAEITTTTAEQKVVQKEKPVKKPAAKKPFSRVKKNELAYMLEPETGVYYRVQVAAGHKKVDIRRYFKKYKLEMEVRKEEHEGWIKYSVGSFPVYRDARDYRVHIWNTTPIDDAFVSAYNNGMRITVQEALMIADQKWYK